MKKSLLALLLAVLMVVSLLPATALADGGITVNGKGSYDTLQAALDAVNQDSTTEKFEIKIPAGEHSLTTQEVINKNITFVGTVHENGAPATTIKGNNDTAMKAIQINGNVEVSFENIAFTEFGGNTNNYGPIYAGTDDAYFTGTISVKNCTFSEFGKNAITVKGGTAVIDNVYIDCSSEVTGRTPNGIQIDHGATATINNVTVRSSATTADEWSATGILVLRGGSATVTNSTIFGCDNGFAVSSYYDTSLTTVGSKSSISNSSITGCNTAVNNDTTSAVKASSNYWGTADLTEITEALSGNVVVEDFYTDSNMTGKEVVGGIPVSSDEQLLAAVEKAQDGDVIVVAPGTYNAVVAFGGKSLTIKAQYPAYYNGVKLSDESGQLSEFTGTFYTGADKTAGSFNEDQSVTIDGFALSGNGLKIGVTNYSTIGNLTVKHCTMEFGVDAEKTQPYPYKTSNKFIYVNGGYNDVFANFVVEDNFVKGTPSGSNNPIQLWGVQTAKVANNMIILENADTFEAIGISKLASDAVIDVYGNTIFGAGTGVSITTWLCGNDSTGETAFEGDVSVEDNTFINVKKPIFVGYQKVDNVPYAAFEGDLVYSGNTNNGATVIPELGQKPGATAYYTVKVDPANGGKVDVITVPSGSTFTTYGAPYNPGYAFLGWACSDGKTYSALQEVTITADTTFTASWVRHADVPYVPEPEEPEEPVTPTFPFYDVSTSAWYYSAVKYVYENKLMDGVDTYVFAPNDTLTRAMVWTIIARMSGVNTTGGANWYAKAQEWVITNGISDGENATAAITRQELVTMLYRYAQIKGYDVSVGENTNILSYVDATSISEYAMSAFQWSCGSGLTEGDENGALTPLATATRAQAAAMIMRFCQSVK